MKRFRGVSRAMRREADLFYADLIGKPLALQRPPGRWTPIQRLPEPWEFPDYEDAPAGRPAPELAAIEDAGSAEAVPRGGRGSFRHDPLGGEPGDNVEARFNVDATTTSGSMIDIVVYLHGYGSLRKVKAPQRDFLARTAVEAGLDMVDSSGAVVRRRTSPTLALIPRGQHKGGRVWGWNNIPNRAAFDALVDAGVKWLCDTVLGLPSGSTLKRRRLTFMAHSGGGAGMAALMTGTNRVEPDEVVCFDSLYGVETHIRDWAVARIASPTASKSGLRVFYKACWESSPANPSGRWVLKGKDYQLIETGPWIYSGRWILQSTEPYARRVHDAIQSPLSTRATLADRFRVQSTAVNHSEIPMQYSGLLLDDIAANLSKTTAPPAKTSRPACVANKDWLTTSDPMSKPGGDAPPPPKPAAPTELAVEEDERVYDAPDRRAYSASASATTFRTAPSPVAVTSATEWPETTDDANRVTDRALRALGVDAAGVATFSGAGMAAMSPIAGAFGEPALIELLRRLRYTAAQLARPPHSFDNDAALTRAFGRPVARPVVLAIRTLLAIPGHFRQLARLAGNEHEAYAIENLGWLVLQSLRDEVRSASGLEFWIPPPPAFVSPFTDPVPGMSPQTERLIIQRMLIDTTLDSAEYQRRYQSWRTGPAGRTWRLETGRETVAGRSAGAPFYPELVSIPATIDIAPQRAQVEAAWTRRVADFTAGRTTVPLTRCDNAYLTPLRVMSPVSLRGLQVRTQFPSPVSAPAVGSLTGLTAVQPAFEAAFQAIADLGWNDLVFETQGLLCFRGMKVPGSPGAARRMSNHSLGTAIDLNEFENKQNTPGTMDPRIVALFEAFRFRWGKGFPVPDPTHFEYTG